MPGPGPHMMYAMGAGQALTSLSNGRFTPHHCITYSINAFFGPDLGSFSEWLTSTIGFGHDFGSALEHLVHHPFYYVLILGFPLSMLYSSASRFLLQKGFLDSISGVPLTKKQCFLLISAGSLSHFFLDHLFEENGHSSMYTWIISTGWWKTRADVNLDAVIVVSFLCVSLIAGFIYINGPKARKSARKQVHQTIGLLVAVASLYSIWCATQIYLVNPRRPAVGEEADLGVLVEYAKLYSVYKAKFIEKISFLIYDREKPWWHQILVPGSEFVNKWNYIFFATHLFALFLDPLYFYLPGMGGVVCMFIDNYLATTITLWRFIVDLFSALHIAMKFRTAYIAPSAKVVERGELVMDPRLIRNHYLKTDFCIDLAAALPLPEIIIWWVVPAMRNDTAAYHNHTISLVILLQYIPRVIIIFPLNQKIINSTGAVAKTAWSGAAYNLLLYILASHVLGATWYLFAFERQYTCWRRECRRENVTHITPCNLEYLDCASAERPDRKAWLLTTKVLANCDARDNPIDFGMFADAFTSKVGSVDFTQKYFYCLWFGLRSLSSYGQCLVTSTYIGETLFGCIVCLAGLVLFSQLIGNIQTYLQSTTARLEEWRVRRRDTEEWMRHRQLPEDLQDRVRRFVQYKWLATRGVDEEVILRALPLDLRRKIQGHLCLALVRRVPFFAQMDGPLLDAICERLVSSLNTKDTYVIREGDPVNEMLFVIRGELDSWTTNGGRTGFFNSITLKAGDFCGEELLTWALVPTSTLNLPSSTRTVKSLTEVEAFALRANDLKFVAKQFKRLHSKTLQHAFRYYSHQWRSWGACFVQTAWKRYTKKKLAEDLAAQESMYYTLLKDEDMEGGNDDKKSAETTSHTDTGVQHLQATILASKFAANTRRGVGQKATKVEPASSSLKMPKLFKPDEPDFYSNQGDG